MYPDEGLERLRIQDLVHAYAEAIDAQDTAAVTALFTEDAVFRVYDRPKGEARGHTQIHALVDTVISGFNATMHHVSGPRTVFTAPSHASGVTSLHAWHAFRAERPVGLLWGRYHDAYARSENSEWRFAERTLVVSGHQDFDFPWITPN